VAWRSKISTGALTCLGVAAFATIVAILWNPGNDASPDSATYVDGARHLARGEGFVTCRTSIDSNAAAPIHVWPPGFPLLMVPGILLGQTALQSARVVLTLSFVIAAILVFALARAVSGPRSWFLPLLAVLLFAFQPSQLRVLNRVQSDVPFVPAVLLSVYLALVVSRAQRPKLWRKLALGAVLAGMVLVRNAGLLVAAGIFVGLFVSMRGSSLVRRIRELVPVAATFAALSAPWMIRNKLVAQTPFGRFGISLTDPLDHATNATSGATAWLTDATDLLEASAVLVGLYVAVIVSVGLVVVVVAVRKGWWKSRSIRLIGCVLVVYGLLMVVTATLHPFNALDQVRFWVVTWPLGAVLFLALMRPAKKKLVWLQRTAVAGMALTALLYGIAFAQNVPKARRAGGYLKSDWKALARLIPPVRHCRLLISDARPVLVHRELGPVSPLPTSRAEFDAALEAHPRLCLVLLTRDFPDDLDSARGRQPKVTPRALELVRSLERRKRLELVKRHPDLRVYEAVR
jgi:hypothetical protein